jgi:methionyl-tRNA formyltransferase
MRIVFFGTPQFAIPTLEKLLSAPQFEVVGVVTQPDKIRGRGNQVIPSPIAKLAQSHQLPTLQPARIKKELETIAALREFAADIFVVIAYGQILSQEILDIPRLGCINVHGSLLPQYRGAAPIQRCLTDGVTVTGITTMLMDAGMDTGAMLLKAETSVSLWDNADSLAARLAEIGANLLVDTLNEFDRITPIPQEDSAATYAPPIQKSAYTIDWSQSSQSIHDRIRGFYPNCTTTFRTQPLKVLATVPLTATGADLPPAIERLQAELANLDFSDAAPGSIVKIAKGLGPIVQTGAGGILLQQVQLPSKRPQSGGDLVNGMRLEVGEALGSRE